MTLSPQEFNELRNSLLDKNKKQPTVQAESGAVQKQLTGIAGFASGGRKGIGSLFKGLGTLGTTIAQQTVGRGVEAITGVPKEQLGAQEFIKGTPEERVATERLEAKTPSQKAGKFIEQFAEFFIPATKIAKGTKALSFIPKLTLRTAGDVAVTGVQTGGDAQTAKEIGLISAGVQTVAPVLKPIIRIFRSFLKGTAGVLSGRGTDVIEQILKTPDEALVGIKGDVIKTLKEDVGTVRNFISYTRKNASESYGKALESLPGGFKQLVPKEGGKVIDVLRPNVDLKDFKESGTFIADVAGQKVPLTMSGIKNTFTKLLKENGVKVQRSADDALDFLETRLSRSEEGILRTVFDDINKWTNTSPQGIDTLAQKINAYKKAGETSPQLNGILSDLSKSTRNYLSKRVPEAKTMVDTFIKQKSFLSELETYLGKVGAIDDPKQIKITLSKLQTLFTKNKEIAREVLESIPEGTEIAGKQAGRELATQIPRSTGSIGGLLQGASQAVISPKFIGELTAYTGKTIQQLQPLVDILSKLEPQARIVILQTYLSAFGE